MNATKEVPNLKSLGEIQRMKLWVEDTQDEDLYPHFDMVSDQASIFEDFNEYVYPFLIILDSRCDSGPWSCAGALRRRGVSFRRHLFGLFAQVSMPIPACRLPFDVLKASDGPSESELLAPTHPLRTGRKVEDSSEKCLKLSLWLQIAKGNVGSVRIVRDEAQPDKLLPDVSVELGLS